PSLLGKLAINAKDLGSFAGSLAEAGVVEVKVPPVFSKPLDVTAAIAGSPAGGEINDLVVQLGKARVQGSLSASLAETVSIDAKFALGRLDLDDFGVFAGGNSNVPSPTDGLASGPAPAKAPAFTLPENMRVKVAISADALDHGGRTVRQVRVEGVLDQGAVSLDVLTAQLPGGTNLTVNGTVYADGGLPRFIGRADVVSDNLRTALQWLDVPLDGLAADRLRKGVFGADIDASPEQVELTNWAVDIDNTRIGGGLSLLIRDRPAFGLSLDIGKINLDAYLPDGTSVGAASSQNVEKATSDKSTGAWVTKLLSAFDANLLIKVEEARYRNTIIRNGALDATIQSGQVVIRDLSIKDVGGAAIRVEGTLAGTVAAPNSDVNVMVTAKSAARLARLAGMDVTESIQKLGGFKFQSKILGSLGALTIDSVLRIAGGRLDTKGVLEPLASPPGLDLAMKFSHPKTENFLALFDESFAARGIALGAGTLTASVLTQPDQSMAIDATLNLAASRLTANGGIQPFAAKPTVKARVTFDHPDIVTLIRFAAPAFKPSRRDLGAASIGFAMAGTADAIYFTNLSVKAGPTLFRGDGGMQLGGPRPKISMRLVTDALDVDPWLPPSAAKPNGVVAAVPPRTDGREWSRDRIDLCGLRAVDADLDLSAKKVTYSSYVIDNFALKAELQGGKLTARQFGGGLFGGRVTGAGRLVAIDTPSADFSLKIENADLREVALAAANKAQVSGILDYETQLSSRGYSEFDLVSALQGNGEFNVRDGSVEGINLPAISEQLKKLDRALDFLVLARKAMNGGASPIDKLSGSYTITDGVLRSDDIALSSKTAAGKTNAVVNLPSQEMDVRSRFWVSEHQNSPPIQVHHVGPLANPRTILDVEKLQAYVLQRVVQRGILRQFDSGAKSPTAPAATTESGVVEKPAELPSLDKIKPRDALKGILKGLLN
ncbi:MAG: AsmA family protein, partial [Alphaproteobacteria bacterium]|nr:AsmA family protein [Alphaproteobacteria bacterium]